MCILLKRYLIWNFILFCTECKKRNLSFWKVFHNFPFFCEKQFSKLMNSWLFRDKFVGKMTGKWMHLHKFRCNDCLWDDLKRVFYFKIFLPQFWESFMWLMQFKKLTAPLGHFEFFNFLPIILNYINISIFSARITPTRFSQQE